MTTRYRVEPKKSRFTVQAFATGLLSFFGHRPTFDVRDFAGEIRIEGSVIEGTRVELTVKADALELLDDVRDTDRKEIEGRMRQEVLETAAYPEITFHTTDASGKKLAPGEYRVRLSGSLPLHGVPHPHEGGGGRQAFEDGDPPRG